MTVSAHARRTPLRPPSPPVCHRSITEMEGDNNNNNSGSCSSAAANGNGNGNGGGSGSPCGACKFLRRKCVRGCVFAPFFNGDEGAGEFAAVHKVFGASNVAKLLSSIPSLCLRRDAVVCVCFEAQWRLRDPVYGCVSHIVALQHQVERLQNELAALYSQVASRRLQSSSHLEQTVSPTNYSNGINASHMSFAMPNNGALVGCCIMQKEGNIGDRPDYSYNSNYSCETAYDASSSSSSSMARLYANSFQQSTSDEQQQEYLQRVAHALLGRAA